MLVGDEVGDEPKTEAEPGAGSSLDCSACPAPKAINASMSAPPVIAHGSHGRAGLVEIGPLALEPAAYGLVEMIGP